MRTRIKLTNTHLTHGQWKSGYDPSLSVNKVWGVPSGWTPMPGATPFIGPYPIKKESMTDVRKGYGQENPCTHITERYSPESYLIDRRIGSTNGNVLIDYGSYGYRMMVENPLFSLVPQSLARPVISAHVPFPKATASSALRIMWPDVKADMSALNFIFELKDLKTLPQSLLSLQRLSAGLKRKRFGKSSLSDISDVHLQANFGIAPFIRDLATAIKAFAELEERYKKYLSDQGKTLRRHYTTEISPGAVPQVNFSLPSTPTAWPGRHTYSTGIVKYSATLVYRYTLPQLLKDSPEQALANFTKDLFGLNWNPKTIWDGLPFSFLIDYVANVGDWLDNMRMTFVQPKVVVLDFIESLSYKTTVETYTTPYGRSNNGERLAGTTVADIYQRRKSVPDLYTSLQLTGLSIGEIINMAALVGGRHRNRKKARKKRIVTL